MSKDVNEIFVQDADLHRVQRFNASEDSELGNYPDVDLGLSVLRDIAERCGDDTLRYQAALALIYYYKNGNGGSTL